MRDRYKVNRYKVNLDDFDLDPRVNEIIQEVEARGGNVLDAYEQLVQEGFEAEASFWVVELYRYITTHMN